MSQPLRSSLTGKMDSMRLISVQEGGMEIPTKCGQVEIAGDASPCSKPEYCDSTVDGCIKKPENSSLSTGRRDETADQDSENNMSVSNTIVQACGLELRASNCKISQSFLPHNNVNCPSTESPSRPVTSAKNSLSVTGLSATVPSHSSSAALTRHNQSDTHSPARTTVKRKATVLEETVEDSNSSPLADQDESKAGSLSIVSNNNNDAPKSSEICAETTVASTVPAGMNEEKEEVTSPRHRPEFFVKDWEFTQTLGEGAYGEVRLAYNVKTKEAVAVKIVDTRGAKHILDDTKKEVVILRMLNHKHVIKFYGVRIEGPIHYLFLQYASGGELYDRIEPDVGMPQVMAQKYFRQLIDGLEYIHDKGVTHRDIKPENLLLDDDDNLKIADFGLATIYKYKNKWRMMERMCGSKPYAAPECMIERPFRATPADIWSTGIVLVAMLAGELPWHAAVLSSQEYSEWRECHILQKPWNKIDNLALCLLRRVLVERPSKRYTVEDIRKNQWFNKDFSNDSTRFSAGPKRRRTSQNESESPGPYTCSQPATSSVESCSRSCKIDDGQSGASSAGADDKPFSFSQPNRVDDLLLSSQISSTQSSQTPMQKLVRRMTRFFSSKTRKEITEELDRVFSLFGYSVRKSSGHVFTLMTTDKRQSTLTFKATLLEMGESLLVDFRLSKGDGLEFKRHFMRIRDFMKPLICKVPPSFPNI